MRSVVVAGAVGQDEFVRDENRWSVFPAMLEQVDHLGDPADVNDLLALHRRLDAGGPSWRYVVRHLGGERLEPRLVAQDAPLKGRVIGAASLGLVNRGGHGARPMYALERLVERFDLGRDEAFGLKNAALHRNRLASFALVKGRIDDIVMAAPGAGQNRRMARPRDAREVDRRTVAHECGAPGYRGEIGNLDRIARELELELGVRKPVEQNHVDARSAPGRVDDLVEHAAVLAFHMDHA